MTTRPDVRSSPATENGTMAHIYRVHITGFSTAEAALIENSLCAESVHWPDRFVPSSPLGLSMGHVPDVVVLNADNPDAVSLFQLSQYANQTPVVCLGGTAFAPNDTLPRPVPPLSLMRALREAVRVREGIAGA